VEDFEKERAFMQQQWERASADMQAEVSGYKKLVEVWVFLTFRYIMFCTIEVDVLKAHTEHVEHRCTSRTAVGG
jgi:hypothetical protein